MTMAVREAYTPDWVEYPATKDRLKMIVPTNDIFAHTLSKACECRPICDGQSVIHSVFYKHLWNPDV